MSEKCICGHFKESHHKVEHYCLKMGCDCPAYYPAIIARQWGWSKVVHAKGDDMAETVCAYCRDEFRVGDMTIFVMHLQENEMAMKKMVHGRCFIKQARRNEKAEDHRRAAGHSDTRESW